MVEILQQQITDELSDLFPLGEIIAVSPNSIYAAGPLTADSNLQISEFLITHENEEKRRYVFKRSALINVQVSEQIDLPKLVAESLLLTDYSYYELPLDGINLARLVTEGGVTSTGEFEQRAVRLVEDLLRDNPDLKEYVSATYENPLQAFAASVSKQKVYPLI